VRGAPKPCARSPGPAGGSAEPRAPSAGWVGGGTEPGAHSCERLARAAQAGGPNPGSTGGARGRPHLNNKTAFWSVTQIPQPSGIQTASHANATSAPGAPEAAV
jgi:hypothetical protein